MLYASGLGQDSLTPFELRTLVNSVRFWIDRFEQVSPEFRDLVPVQADTEGDAASAAAQERGELPVRVFANLLAFDGRKMRVFSNAWAKIVKALDLTGFDAFNPVSFEADSIAQSLTRLRQIENRLAGKVPPEPPPPPRKPRGRLVGALAILAGTLGVVGASYVATTR